jgi:hypothetical protein
VNIKVVVLLLLLLLRKQFDKKLLFLTSLKPFVTDILEESQAQYRQRQRKMLVMFLMQGAADCYSLLLNSNRRFRQHVVFLKRVLSGTPLGQSTTYLAPALGATTAAQHFQLLPTQYWSVYGPIS